VCAVASHVNENDGSTMVLYMMKAGAVRPRATAPLATMTKASPGRRLHAREVARHAIRTEDAPQRSNSPGAMGFQRGDGDEDALFEGWHKALHTSMPGESSYVVGGEDIVGEIPADLCGTLFKVGPALFERGGVSVGHIFDGDGAAHSLTIDGSKGEVRYATKFVRTRGFEQDEAAGRFTMRGALATPKPPASLPFTDVKLPEFTANAFDLDFKNTSNITCIPWAGKILVGWNALPYALDPETLETLGIEDFGGAFEADDKVQAHFAIDAAQERLLLFALNTTDPSAYKIKFCEFDATMGLVSKRVERLPIQGGVPILHDIAITDDYAVLFQAPLAIENADMLQLLAGTKNLVDVIRFQKEEPHCKLMLVPRGKDASAASLPMKVLDAPNSWTWHIGGVAGDKDHISLTAFSTPDYHFKFDFTGAYGKDYVRSRLTRYEIDVRGKEVTAETLCARNMEMPDCAMNRTDVSFVYSLTTTRDEGFGPLQNLVKTDVTAGKGKEGKEGEGEGAAADPVVAVWQTPQADQFLSEPTFVAKRDAKEEDDGYVLALMHDAGAMKARLLIFDAKRIDQGPTAQVPLSTWIPWIFHGCFVQA